MSNLNVKRLTLLDNISSDDIKAMLLSFLKDDEIAALKDFIQAVPLIPENEWIDVNKRLPKKGVDVLIYSPNCDGHQFVASSINPDWMTHWQPLPANPTKEEKA